MYKWTSEHITFHRDLLKRSRSMSWRDLLLECLPGCQLEDPLTPEEIRAAEKKLGMLLPEELSSFYLASGALNSEAHSLIVSPLPSVVEENLDLWGGRLNNRCMPFHGVFVFGTPGNGDKYFYPRLGNGKFGESIFLWAPETDSRTWQAESLKSILIHTRTDMLVVP